MGSDSDYWGPLRRHVREAFRFLETEYGYRCSDDSGIGVTYRKGKLTVSVFQGRPGDVIEIDFTGSVAAGVGLMTIAEWCKRPAPGTQPSPTTLHVVIANLAAYVRENCGPLIGGDPQAFAVLRAVAVKRHAAYNQQHLAYQGRRDVAEAWTRQNYALVARLLSQANWALKPSEKKMLAIALRRSGLSET